LLSTATAAHPTQRPAALQGKFRVYEMLQKKTGARNTMVMALRLAEVGELVVSGVSKPRTVSPAA
jgi:hypothetical protein